MTVETVTSAIMGKKSGIIKSQRRFILHIVRLLLQIRGRVNFTNLARYSCHVEQYYRKWFSKPFDFGEFNRHLGLRFEGSERIIGFDIKLNRIRNATNLVIEAVFSTTNEGNTDVKIFSTQSIQVRIGMKIGL